MKESSKADYEVSVLRLAGPIQESITDLCNYRHEAVAHNDASNLAKIDRDIDEQMEDFEKTEALFALIPARAVATMRAAVRHARGDHPATYEYNWKAWKATTAAHAHVPEHLRTRMLAVTANNLFEACIRMDRINEAVAWAYLARSLDPSPVRLLALVRAEYAAGNIDEADRLLSLALTESKQPGSDDLRKALKYDRALRALCDLPAQKKLCELFPEIQD
jgi:tetratricopeptide (TPR) repeat protein